MNLAALVTVSAFLAATACSSTNAAQPAPHGDAGAPGSAAEPISCAAIFDCAGLCNGDDPCARACLARGSGEAQTAATALATCFTDHKCNDGDCLVANCKAEADTCLNQGGATGTPLAPGDAMPGRVPKELVGSWVHTNYGANERFVFNADGTGYYQTGLTSAASCAISKETVYTGTAVVDATTITIYATTVTNEQFVCGRKTSTNDPPQTLHFSYTYAASTDLLTALNLECAAKYADSPASQDLYCSNDHRRE